MYTVLIIFRIIISATNVRPLGHLPQRKIFFSRIDAKIPNMRKRDVYVLYIARNNVVLELIRDAANYPMGA